MAFTLSRRAVLCAAAGSLLALTTPLALAQAWPERPLRLVVPFPPGGLIDSMARLVSAHLGQALGQTVVVDNKPGAGGNIGAADAARANPDGYTLLMASPAITISPAVYKSLPYAPDSLEAIAMLGRVPNVLVVNTESGIKTVQELVAQAKAKPGALNYASNGNGTSLHLSAELFKSLTNTDVTHVPYRGSAAASSAMLGNEVNMMFDNLPSAMGQIQAGRLRALAVTTAQRSESLPDVPTLMEAGLSNFNVSAWFGVVAPAGVPPEVVARLSAALAEVVKNPDVVAAMKRQGAEPAFMDPKTTTAALAGDAAQWKQVATAANIVID